MYDEYGYIARKFSFYRPGGEWIHQEAHSGTHEAALADFLNGRGNVSSITKERYFKPGDMVIVVLDGGPGHGRVKAFVVEAPPTPLLTGRPL